MNMILIKSFSFPFWDFHFGTEITLLVFNILLNDSNRRKRYTSDKMRKIQQRHRVPIEDLDFLASKFLLIIPEHLHGDRARIGFQLEKAFWRYINQFEEEKVARMENYFQLKDFAQQIFPRVPFLRHHVDIVEEVIADFMDYKRSVPTYGVILLNSSLDKVLLVQSYKRKRWGFPKGKVNENERGEVCAAREAEEEIGLNVDELLDPDTWCEQVCLFVCLLCFFCYCVSLFVFCLFVFDSMLTLFWTQTLCVNRFGWKYSTYYRLATNKQKNRHLLH